MADLLSSGDMAEIRAAFGDVADTFYKTVVTYRKWVGNASRFKEDDEDAAYTSYNILAMVEYGNLESGRFIIRESVDDSGKVDTASTKITINIDYLDATHSLWDDANNMALMNYGKDKLYIGGKEYDITQLTYDGPIEARPVLLIIYADPKPNIA